MFIQIDVHQLRARMRTFPLSWRHLFSSQRTCNQFVCHVKATEYDDEAVVGLYINAKFNKNQLQLNVIRLQVSLGKDE